MPKVFMVGGAIFGASVFLVLILLVANGGASKSRQFEVLGNLLSGRQGGAMRALTILAFAGIAIGALTLFSAVGKNDAARRKQCQDTCALRGYKKGAMGLSSTRDAQGKYLKICRCTEGADKDLEIEISKLPALEPAE